LDCKHGIQPTHENHNFLDLKSKDHMGVYGIAAQVSCSNLVLL
jgi:hypothetical protein